jgi:hypothetical protein
MKKKIYIFIIFLSQVYFELEMFSTKVAEKIKTHILYSVTFLSKIVQIMI